MLHIIIPIYKTMLKYVSFGDFKYCEFDMENSKKEMFTLFPSFM